VGGTEKHFTLGFMGTSTNEVLEAGAEFIPEGTKHLFMPMTGSGKDVAYLSQRFPEMTIHSYDTQYLSWLMVQGVFNGTGDSVIEGVELREVNYTGWATLNDPFKRMTPFSKSLIDYIATDGTDFDRAVLCKSIIQATIAGRLTHWEREDDKFLESIGRNIVFMRQFVDLPGKRKHIHESVFDCLEIEGAAMTPDTVMWVDPPKVVDVSDVYSKLFWKLNSMLEQQTVELPRWKHGDVIPLHKKLWELPVKRIIQFYCSDVRPTDEQMVDALYKYGTPATERVRLRHTSKADYIHVIDK
jgi:hypothetical protein